jgi:acetyl-CoA acetyltransferase
MTALERTVAVTGMGRSAIGRRLGQHPLALTLDACLQAIADAGLSREDVDGMATYPGGAIAAPRGYVGPGVAEVQDALRLKLNWAGSGLESTGPLGPFINACAAVATGLATHALCYCTVWEATARAEKKQAPPGPERVSGDLQWTVPFRALSPANWIALYASRQFHHYGTTREQLAQISLTQRRNAGANPAAIYREPLSMEQYLAAPMVSTPLCLFDCDVPADGCVAIVISSAQSARSLRKAPLRIESIGCALRDRPSWDQRTDLDTMAAHDASAMLWSRTDLKAADVDVAQLYDGFSILTLLWLEALGFCQPGEAGAFVEGGKRIALDGELPLNTDGGQLSAGRLNGHGLLREACAQLWGEAGACQVPSGPKVALVSAGGGPFASCLLLSRAD